MTFTEWFLIQSPTIQQILMIKSGLATFALFFCFMEKSRWTTFVMIYGLTCGTIASLIPGKDEAEKIRSLIHAK